MNVKVSGFHLMDCCILNSTRSRQKNKNKKKQNRVQSVPAALRIQQNVYLSVRRWTKVCLNITDVLPFAVMRVLTHGLDEVSPDNPEKKTGLKRQGYTFNIIIIKNKLPTVYGTVSESWIRKQKLKGKNFLLFCNSCKNSKLTKIQWLFS